MYLYGWVPSLSTWNYRNIGNWLYPNTECFGVKKNIQFVGLGKSLKRWEYQTTWLASWEICMQVKKQQLELDMEQQAGSK